MILLRKKTTNQFDLLRDMPSKFSLQNKYCYLLTYTVIFLITFTFVYWPLVHKGFSLIGVNDGRNQFFPMLVYLGRTVRWVFLELLGGNLSLPLFDINIGLGEDVIGLLSAHGMLDPLTLFLSPLIPTKYAEVLYNFLVVTYLWLAGLSFSYLCFTYGKRPLFTIIGAVVYCFGGLSIQWIPLEFTLFTIGLIQLPLLIVGINKIKNNGSPALFVLVICWASINKFYTLYMMIFPICAYVVISFFDRRIKKVSGASSGATLTKNFLVYATKILGFSLLGMGMAGIIFIPSIFYYFGSSRSVDKIVTSFPWSFPKGAVIDFLLGLFVSPPTEDSGYISIAGIALFSIVLLFMSRQRYGLKALFAIGFIVCFSPFLLFIVSGFQYLHYRWIFCLSLLLAFCVVEMMPELIAMTRKQYIACLIAYFVYTIFVLVEVYRGFPFRPLIGLCFLGLTLSVLGMKSAQGVMHIKKNTGVNSLAVIVLFVAIINVGFMGIWRSIPTGDGLRSLMTKFGEETNRITNSPIFSFAPLTPGLPFGRLDGTGIVWGRHYQGMVWKVPTALMSYNSVENGNLIEFWKKIEHSDRNMVFGHFSSDHRLIPLTLLSSRYYAALSDDDPYIPQKYKKINRLDKSTMLYENQLTLPIGYTYDATVPYGYLESLNGLERQDAMLRAIALPGYEKKQDLELAVKTIPFGITTDGIKIEDGKISILKPHASMTITYENQKDSEMYLRLEGFEIPVRENLYIVVDSGGIYKNTYHFPDFAPYYQGVENYLYNLGSKREGKGTVKVTFSNAGVFPLKKIQILSESFEDYPRLVSALTEESLRNVRWEGNNKLSGTIDLTKEKILCISIPYSKGWSAYVDNKKTSILRGNYMFIAIPLKAGHHEVELVYRPPGLWLGLTSSLLSLLIFLVILYKQRVKLKRTKDVKLQVAPIS